MGLLDIFKKKNTASAAKTNTSKIPGTSYVPKPGYVSPVLPTQKIISTGKNVSNPIRNVYTKNLENQLKNSGTSSGTTSASSGSSGTSKSSGGGSSSSGGSYSAPVYDTSAQDRYNRQLARAQERYNRQMAEYNRAKQAYEDYYNKLARQRKANLDATLSANNTTADKSSQEAYVAYMQSLKNLPQQLRNAGISGGGSETTLTDISNTYQNNRNNIITDRDKNNARAQLAYSQGTADDYGDYISKVTALTQPTLELPTINVQRSKSSSSSGTSKAVGTKVGSSGTSKSSGTTSKGSGSSQNSADILQQLYGQYSLMGMSHDEITERLRQLGIVG